MYLITLPLIMCFAPEWIFVLLFGKLAQRYWQRIHACSASS